MATVLGIRELVDYIKSLPNGLNKAMAKAHFATITMAERYAKKNAVTQFTGRNDRRLSGALLNSIYSGMEKDGTDLVGFVGVRNVPYGAIHEFGSGGLPGGVITPKNAKNLWRPQYRNAGKMTPREFIRLKIQNPGQFFLNDKVAGKWSNPKSKAKQLIPLFFLVKKVKIPERPYVRPAMEEAIPLFPNYLEKFLKEEIE